MQQDFPLENSAYIDGLFHVYCTQPETLTEEWRQYFDQLIGYPIRVHGTSDAPVPTLASSRNTTALATQIAKRMIQSYRAWGHNKSQLDPLNLTQPVRHPDLEWDTYFSNEGVSPNDPVELSQDKAHFGKTLGEVWNRLQSLFTGTLAVEFTHIQDVERRTFIQNAFEHTSLSPNLTTQDQKKALHHLLKAEIFEQFLHKKFPGAKRFGLDGGEALMPLIHACLDHARHPKIDRNGVEYTVIGIAHRGRLNVLTNVLNKPYRKLFSKFIASKEDPFATGSGDVKYHLGYSHDAMIGDKPMHISLMPNPSHLEAVNPVVMGKVRAEQRNARDDTRSKVMGLLIHGDAAFAGQGLVAETLELSALPGYQTGGTLHIIINNQIGFTTSPKYARSSPHASDVAKTIQAPILHVNGDDTEAVLRAGSIASSYRQTFAHDVVINLVCYRRFGHNESDEPRFTQPCMYEAITNQPSVASKYGDYLVRMGVLSQGELDTMRDDMYALLEAEYKRALAYDDCFDDPYWLQGAWKDIVPTPKDDTSFEMDARTGIAQDRAKKLGTILFAVPDQVYKKDGIATAFAPDEGVQPDTFHLNTKIQRQLNLKQKMMSDAAGIDWGTAEALAFAALIEDGHPIRLSGQDCGRGTFSHRHAVFVDQRDESRYYPLAHIQPKRSMFRVIDSPLAEASVLGFEFGYSVASPHGLTLWEAQFGDFSNGAQVIIDQFLSSSDMKWARQSGLVLLLPHGYEGQGPEHSSARLERFLQLCAQGNWTVANCSTPANYFHILRRQIKQAYRRPLILMTPKSLLRHPLCVSELSDFEGTFQPVIAPPLPADPKSIQRVILCAGKVYYDLLNYATEHADDPDVQKTVIIRLEQFYPWPHACLQDALSPYAHGTFVWCQEEPRNMGAWHFLDRRLEQTLTSCGAVRARPYVASRPAASSPATGIVSRHEKECFNLYHTAFKANQETLEQILFSNPIPPDIVE